MKFQSEVITRLQDQISQPSSLLGSDCFSGITPIQAWYLLKHLLSMAQNQTATRWLHYTLVWTECRYLRRLLGVSIPCTGNVSLWGLAMSMHRNCLITQRTVIVGVQRSGEVWCDLSAKVSMATSPRFPWRCCAGRSQCKCIGLESEKNNDTASAWGQIAPDMHIML